MVGRWNEDWNLICFTISAHIHKRAQMISCTNISRSCMGLIRSVTPELLSNEDKWSDKEWKIMEITSTRKLKFSNHTSLEHYNPGATDLAIAPNLQCRSLQSCQRLELHAEVCKTNVKSNRWGRGEDKEERFTDFTT